MKLGYQGYEDLRPADSEILVENWLFCYMLTHLADEIQQEME